jgi:hypothetical protein
MTYLSLSLRALSVSRARSFVCLKLCVVDGNAGTYRPTSRHKLGPIAAPAVNNAQIAGDNTPGDEVPTSRTTEGTDLHDH